MEKIQLLSAEESDELDRLRKEHEDATNRVEAAAREASDLWRRIKELLAKADRNWAG
jgi:uncharacterized coiled-coil DUF342 family protein